MATAGDILRSAAGESITFLETAADSGGERLLMEVVYLPSHRRPPPHYHPQQEEHFEVLEGEIHVRRGDEELSFRAGESFEIPAGTVHAMWSGDAPATRLRWEIRPALRSEDFFETMWSLPDDERPSPFTLARILDRHRREFRLARPPYPVQRLLFGALILIGRLLGRS